MEKIELEITTDGFARAVALVSSDRIRIVTETRSMQDGVWQPWRKSCESVSISRTAFVKLIGHSIVDRAVIVGGQLFWSLDDDEREALKPIVEVESS